MMRAGIAALLGAAAVALLVAPTRALQDGARELRMTPTVAVVQAVGPAVVNVYQDGVQELPYPWNRVLGPQSTHRTSLGSGFVIDDEGYILTNAHVIEFGSEGIQVRLSNGDEYDAVLVNLDAENDIALLKITLKPGRSLVEAPLGTSSDLMVGESVITIGNPLGHENSVSTGIVSSLFRNVRVPSGNNPSGLSPEFKDFIQTDAPINRGNSGGPLLNVLGEVVGINFAVANQAEGIGFAIPIDRVRRSLIANLLNPRLHREVVTGLEIGGDRMGRNVLLRHVTPGGPAAAAGLRTGDQLIEVLGTPIEWEFDYNKALLATRPGDRITVLVRRGDRTIPAQIELGGDESPMLHIWRALGLSVVDHPRYKGVRVQNVDPAGPGAVLGIREGDLIDGVDQRDLDGVEDLYTSVRELDTGDRVVVHVWRGGVASAGKLQLR